MNKAYKGLRKGEDLWRVKVLPECAPLDVLTAEPDMNALLQEWPEGQSLA